MRRISSKGQVWVETVIYTLIGLAIIGIVLGISKPKIDAKKDEIIIEQSIEALGNINNKVDIVIASGVGNKRIADLKIGKGDFIIDMKNNSVRWEIPASFKYSEVGITIPIGAVGVTTTKKGDSFLVTLEVKYPADILFKGVTDPTKTFFAAPIPYSISMENNGTNADGNLMVVFSEN